MVLMLAAVLVVSLLIFKGYSSGLSGNSGEAAATAPAQFDPVSKAKSVEPLLLDAAGEQRQAIEKQLQ
jgi:hypothetical protein